MSGMTTEPEIRILHTPAEMAAAEALQQAVWTGNDLEIVPAHLLLTAAHNGGLVAGAFVAGRLVGLVFSFLGLMTASRPPRLKHCSHLLGVHPDFRNAGIGYALKCFQRRYVLEQGLDHITWTYDPLLCSNAHLNIARLGAICCTYRRDLYGELRDDLNVGLPTDRFQVDWWLTAPRVVERIEGKRPSLPDLKHAQLFGPPTPAAIPAPDALTTSALPPVVLVEIPTNFLALKRHDPTQALAWRLHSRAIFETLFARSFVVTDFVQNPMPQVQAAYVLQQNDGTIAPRS